MCALKNVFRQPPHKVVILSGARRTFVAWHSDIADEDVPVIIEFSTRRILFSGFGG
jgi:hypothetical protein